MNWFPVGIGGCIGFRLELVDELIKLSRAFSDLS